MTTLTAQASLFDPPTLPYQPHRGTSRTAARSMREVAGAKRAAVLEYVRANGPVTDEEIARDLGMNPSTARPRRVELERQGFITSAGTALTASGRTATVWVAR